MDDYDHIVALQAEAKELQDTILDVRSAANKTQLSWSSYSAYHIISSGGFIWTASEKNWNAV
jgi:hypothetical protein